MPRSSRRLQIGHFAGKTLRGAIPETEIREQLARILTSGHFVNAQQQSRLLRYLVEQSLRSGPDGVKEQVIGAEVFERGSQFDPAVDTIVRVAATRLRDRLRRYFRTEGRLDPILIQLKKGGYAVSFLRRPSRPSTSGASAAARTTLAVLPFHNLSGDPDQEFLCDGIAEELIHRLSKLPGLRVIAWSSTRRLKGSAYELSQLGERLRVGAVVEGSFRGDGKHLRVTAQLVETEGCCCVWSEVFDAAAGDVLSIPERIAQVIVAGLPVNHLRVSRARLPSLRIDDPATQNLYLKGRHHLNRRTDEGLRRAVEYFERIIRADPGHARAQSALAEASTLRGWYCFAAPNQVMPPAKASALEAVRLDSRLAEGHLALGLVSELYDRNWAKALDSLTLAVELDPGGATAQFEYGFFLCRTGDIHEGMSAMRRARELDPLSPVVNTNLGVGCYYERDYDNAVRHFLEALGLDRAYVPAHYRLALAYLKQGLLAKAQESLDDVMAFPDAGPLVQALAGYTMARAGRKSAAANIRQALVEAAADRYVSPVAIAIVSIGLEDLSSALDWLLRGVDSNDLLLVDLKIDPIYDSVRGDPRFGKLLTDLKLD